MTRDGGGTATLVAVAPGSYTSAMPRATLSDAIQDYLRAAYALGAGGERITTTGLARAVAVSPASTSAGADVPTLPKAV